MNATPPPRATILLGPEDEADRIELLRDGALEVRSRRGLRYVEALLVNALPSSPPARALTGLDANGLVAAAARILWGPEPALSWWHSDAYVAERAGGTLERLAAEGVLPGEVTRLCAPDLPGVPVPGEPPPEPAEPLDLVALPFPRAQPAILGRELIEEAQVALRPGGRLLAATDDPKGTWLKKVLRDVFGNATVVHAARKRGMVLAARRTRERAEVRDHRHPIRATLRGRTLELTSRPGVFGHVGLDWGTRELAEAFEVGPADVVLDLGCGYGPLALAAAAAAPDGRAVGVDCNTRAAALAARNAEANGLTNARALLRTNLEDLGEPAFDLVLANPPSFANFRVASAFVARAAEVLRPGGRLYLVARGAEKHAALLGEEFEGVAVQIGARGHGIISARRGPANPAGGS